MQVHAGRIHKKGPVGMKHEKFAVLRRMQDVHTRHTQLVHDKRDALLFGIILEGHTGMLCRQITSRVRDVGL